MTRADAPLAPDAATHAAAAISVRQLCKDYRDGNGTLRAIDRLDLAVAPGEFVCILGPSGCGKSSLLNVLAGFERPSEGIAMLNDEPIVGPSVRQGVVFQDTAALFPWLTVRRNVAFGLRNQRLRRDERERRVADVLDLVGLRAFADRWPHQLSGGMRQLASIARVLVTDSRVLLMDEPFAALDALTRQRMQHKLLEIWRATGITVVLITHSVDEAFYLGARVVVLTPRPARLACEIPVPLPYPRDLTAPDFNRLKTDALTHLGF